MSTQVVPYLAEAITTNANSSHRLAEIETTANDPMSLVKLPCGVADLERSEIRHDDGNRDELSGREAELLRYLAANPDRPVSRDEILQQVWHLDPRRLITRTIDMPLDVLLALTAAVKRGAPNQHVMGDMPFMSYQADEAEAIRNAGRFMTEGLADSVKVEADASFAPLISKMARAGIPVCGHVGSRPQLAALKGGYGAAGRTATEANQIVADAVALEQAGAVLLLVEAVPDEVTKRILERTSVPLIGIGAGEQCHGQVLVLHDLLGLTDTPPRFAEPAAKLGPVVQQAAEQWIQRVKDRQIGGRRYTMPPAEADKLRIQSPPPPLASE